MKMRYLALTIISLGLILSSLANADDTYDSVPLAANEVRSRWHNRLAHRKFVARLTMIMDFAGLKERRELIVYRDDLGRSNERVLAYFLSPADLRKTAILYLEQAERSNDYFLYQKTTRRVRRLPESIADDDIYGIDLEFLGFGVAQNEPTETVDMKQEEIDGQLTYRISERAIRPNSRFDERTTWVDASSYIPIKTEHVYKGDTVLVARTTTIQLHDGVPTPTEMHFLKTAGRETREVWLHIESIDYDFDMPEDVFSVFRLARSRTRPRINHD